MFNETQQEEVRQNLLQWLEKVMVQRAPDPAMED
jgi:hypothetical protein